MPANSAARQSFVDCRVCVGLQVLCQARMSDRALSMVSRVLHFNFDRTLNCTAGLPKYRRHHCMNLFPVEGPFP
jgi:hypothetical protein